MAGWYHQAGSALIGMYLALANVPQLYAGNTSGLESRVEHVQHGIRNGKYRVDADIIVKNNGSDVPTGSVMFYSLCFEVPENNGKKSSQCVDGKTTTLDRGMKRGEEWKREVILRLRGSPEIQNQAGQTFPIRGLKPKVTVHAESGRTTLFKQDHYLTPIGDYVCEQYCPGEQ